MCNQCNDALNGSHMTCGCKGFTIVNAFLLTMTLYNKPWLVVFDCTISFMCDLVNPLYANGCFYMRQVNQFFLLSFFSSPFYPSLTVLLFILCKSSSLGDSGKIQSKWIVQPIGIPSFVTKLSFRAMNQKYHLFLDH